MLRVALLLSILFSGMAYANNQIVGVWENKEKTTRLDILDGFKPNRGAVLLIENGVEAEVGTWETNGPDTSLAIRWRSATVRFRGPNSFEWNQSIFDKREEVVEDAVAVLKDDEVAFIDGLRRTAWRSSDAGKELTFKSTFSNDSGVVETFSVDGELYSLTPWGVASGVLKIDNVVVVEARVSKNYLIGQDHKDNFLVLRATTVTPTQGRTDLSTQRSEFLTALVTDTWQQVRYGGYIDHKFRPIEGPLKGRDIRLKHDKLVDGAVWEYSPSTGALKIGYKEYTGGLVVGDTLALMEKDGDQIFFKRKPGGAKKVFSVADLAVHKVNETRGNELEAVLAGQFQRGDYLYSVEFNIDGRTGFVHKWRSEPFTIAGHELTNSLFTETESMYALEDFLVLDDDFILKRDASPSRLRPKSEDEIVQDQMAMEEKLESLGQTTVILRVTDHEGTMQDIVLPFRSMGDIGRIELLTRKE